MLANIGILFLLLLLNGFFAMAELAVVSARRARLRQMQDEGRKGAGAALRLTDDTASFLSVVQIGVTLNSILAGAFSASVLAVPLGEYLNGYEFISPFGESVAVAVTVVGITYFSLVLGELLPKRIGLSYAEVISVRVAWVMVVLTKLLSPAIWVLRLSTDLALKFLRLNNPGSACVTEEEVKDLIAEGTESGVFKPAEKHMLEGVMRLSDRTVRTIMTPRMDMIWLGSDDSPEEQLRTIHDSGHSRFPVAKGDLDEVVGIVYAKDLLNLAFEKKAINICSIMRTALNVPDTTPVLRLLDQLKSAGQHMAIVMDEYGSVEGLVSTTDILEAITGELPEYGQESDGKPVMREDGSWLFDGMTPVDEVGNIIGLKNMQGGGDYHTIAGFVIDKLGRIPAAGDHFHWADARFEVVDMDARRVDKVLINPPVKTVENLEQDE